MGKIRAVLFDFGGTLFDYETVAVGERECIVELARWVGIGEDARAILRAYRASLKQVFYQYLPRSYYLHRDLFRDVLQGMAESFGLQFSEEQLERYRDVQRQRRERDFVLREGVP